MERKVENWKIEVNDRYHKIVDVIIGLSTASLVLPIVFFREFLGLKSGENFSNYIDLKILISWSLWISAIFFGCLFFYASAKWVKQAHDQKTCWSEKTLECILDFSFWLMVLCFLIGMILFLCFAFTFNTAC